jgi:hypothetical protein
MTHAPTTAQARADAARLSPFWPFAQLTPMQMRQRAQQERALQTQARAQLPEALL